MPDLSSTSSPKIAQIACDFWFEASHILRRSDWTEERNLAVFGKCTRLHGHSYQLRVALRGPIDPETGMILNFSDLKAVIRERILGPLDHRHLNDLLGDLPTAEVIVHWIAEQLIPALPDLGWTRIELWETRNACALLDAEDLARIAKTLSG